MHPIIGAEELSRERDELGISRMIQSLYRADPLLHVRPVLGYVVFSIPTWRWQDAASCVRKRTFTN